MRVALRGRAHLPVPGGGRARVGDALRLGPQRRLARHERAAERVVRPGRDRLGVDLHDGVVGAVDVEVEAHAEQVLVVRCGQLPADPPAVRHVGPLHRGAGVEDAGQLHLELDRAVEVEVPEDAVLVVADGVHRRDDEAATATHLGQAREVVGVLPEDAVVLLVDADRVAGRARVAVGQREVRVQVADLAQAVAAEREGVGERAEAVLADVHDVLEAVVGCDIAVRHDHLGQRRALQHRPRHAVVNPRDVVQHEAVDRVHGRGEPPAVPA